MGRMRLGLYARTHETGETWMLGTFYELWYDADTMGAVGATELSVRGYAGCNVLSGNCPKLRCTFKRKYDDSMCGRVNGEI